MKIAIAQINYKAGDIENNTHKIISAIAKAKQAKADMVVFSELCVCGYPPYDLLGFEAFLNACNKSVDEITRHTEDIAVIIGAPEQNKDVKAKPLYNAAYFIYQKEIKHKAYKGLLPDYDVFDECRYFEPHKDFEVYNFKGKKIALTICEDLWNIGREGLYKVNPMEALSEQSPDLIVNIAASPFDYEQPQQRLNIMRANVEKYGTPLLYVNQVGAQTDLIFDGGSFAIDSNGHILQSCHLFEEDFRSVSIFENGTKINDNTHSKIALIHKALVLGIKDYFQKSGLSKAVLGLSGGLDSALTYALAVEALGAANVHALLMPSAFSSEHSLTDAKALAANVGGTYDVIPINNSYEAVMENFTALFDGLKFDVTEENIQARLRGLLLMAYANKFGYMLLNTSNKSEAAVGYGTLYGDMCGGLSVLGDVYKTEIYELSKYINRNCEIIPPNSLSKAPSAELRPNQKDSDSLPDYELLDRILYLYIEKNLSATQIVAEGYPQNIVQKVLHLVNINEHKRYQTAPILRISPKAFGCGRKIPVVASFKSLYQ